MTLFEKIYMESLRDMTYTPLLAFFYHWGIGNKLADVLTLALDR
ncbi:8256_t:CDS:2 [Ambispora leptoticha]|uniref:8256_t:CDS:1 n=1 Tax=Ambispora leptoticha TaxID=144679 RepID=A0A9N8WM56_9GLOM|nr:8256_t:CDS:2 [Ambispora leptoticha]